MLRVRLTLGLGRKRELSRLIQRGESFSEPDDERGLASMEKEAACIARNVGFFLVDAVGGGDATANNSSRLGSEILAFSLSSTSIESETWLFAI
jgi:hypothetical protein